MRKRIATPLVFVLISSVSALAQSEGYDNRSFARLSYVSGETHVQRAGDMGFEAGAVNLVLVEGDKLATQNGRAEVNFAGLNVVRLDGASQLEFVNLPRDGIEPFKLHLFSGSLYLRVSRMSSDKEFEVHTPDASLYVLTEGLFRVDVLENQQTRFSAIEGEAETAGGERSFTLRPGQSVAAFEGRFLAGPEALSASRDEFDRWSLSRDALMAGNRSESSYLPDELDEYEAELAENGQWRYEADYGYVWVPRVRYYDDWRPYSYGRWVWYPIIGWTWIPYEPWGWCVYHYGRWHWSLSLGWYWIPTRHWGPAWVHWYWDYRYVGWCPLNRWNRPTVVINNHFYGRYGRSDYSVHNRALVVVNRRQLQAPRIASVALRGEALNRLGSITLSARQPSIAPTVSRTGKLSAEAARTFNLSRGRTIERTFGGRDAAGKGVRRTQDVQRSLRSSKSSPGALPRTLSPRSEPQGRSVAGRASQKGISSRTSSGVREYALPGRAGGAPGPAVRSKTAAPSGALRSAPQVRSYASRDRRTAAGPSVGTGSRKMSAPGEYLSRTPSRTGVSKRAVAPVRQRAPNVSPTRKTTASSSRSSSSRSSSSVGFVNPRKSSPLLSNRSRSGSSTAPRRAITGNRRTAVSTPRSYSKPSYSRPSYRLTSPAPRSSSARTYSSPSRSSQRRSSISSPSRSRSSSRSISSPRTSSRSSRSLSRSSRSSASVSKSRSSSSRSSSSRSARSSRRK